jgi:hypothetical protein
MGRYKGLIILYEYYTSSVGTLIAIIKLEIPFIALLKANTII